MSASRRALLAVGALAIAMPIALTAPALAFDDASSRAVNLAKGALALKGYDPVAYFTIGKPTPGDPGLTATHDGATYRFATAEHRDAFLKEPVKFLPQYGGFCAWAASAGYKADADPTAWKIVEGKLYVNYNASVQKGWAADAANLIRKGDANWPRIAAKAPRELK